MIYLSLTLAFLLAAAIFAYKTSGNNILSHTFVLSLLFAICVIFAIFGNERWGVQIDPLLLIVFVVAIVSLWCGEMVGKGVRIQLTRRLETGRQDVQKKLTSRGLINVPFSRMVLVIFFCIVVTALFVKRQIEIATSIGYSGTMLVQYVRAATTILGMKMGAFYTIMRGFVDAVSYECIFVLINNLFINRENAKIKNNMLYFIPIVCTCILIVISGARNGIIQILVMLFVMTILLYQKM